MLRINENKTALGAKTYYVGESMGEYYAEGQEMAGHWRGQGAERLGLHGGIAKEAWEALCENRDPNTGERLTARTKANRRIGYDFNFHAPKSLSLLYGLTGDERMLEAFRSSVDETMREIEADMKTRVRIGGKNVDRSSPNMVWGEFIHQTARPVKGIPDPHLHAHCFTFNVNFDEVEQRFKAAQFGPIKQDASFYQASFHSRLSSRLTALGLPIEQTRKGWEIAGLSRQTVEKFSRRHAVVEEKFKALQAEAEQERAAARARGEEAELPPLTKHDLGASTRERKRKDLSMPELRREWVARLSAAEADSIRKLNDQVGGGGGSGDKDRAREAAALAVEHCFERNSVLPHRQVLAEAMKRAYGNATPEQVTAALGELPLIIGEIGGRRMATTRQVLEEERAMVRFAREGRGQCDPLVAGPHKIRNEKLNEDQRRAVEHVIFSNDRIILVKGGPGTGKTSSMKEAAEAIEAAGKKVCTFAPSADASRGTLRAEGFKDAETIAMLLMDKKLQRAAAGNVIWIDEAGLVGSKTLSQIFALAEKIDARVVLQGDTSQHGSVERGAALRQLQAEAGLKPAELKTILRQKDAYRDAVRLLGDGETEAGFKALDRLGWIKEVPDAERYAALAQDYVTTVEEKKRALVIAPTHVEEQRVNEALRAALRKAKILKADERQFTVLQNANLTVAERRDQQNFCDGDIIEYHQNAPKRKKGQRLVVGKDSITSGDAERFTAYRTRSLALAKSDLIRITKNGKTLEGSRLNNGSVARVAGFTKNGDIRLAGKGTISKDWGQWTYGYSQTSYSSQGRTTDVVLVAQSDDSFPASSIQQFYVSVSRGKQRACVYTADKQALLEAVSQSDVRTTASELALTHDHYDRVATIGRAREATAERVVVIQPERVREAFHERW
jgi:conjugative relaxase-like TrwC/TraI family protein